MVRQRVFDVAEADLIHREALGLAGRTGRWRVGIGFGQVDPQTSTPAQLFGPLGGDIDEQKAAAPRIDDIPRIGADHGFFSRFGGFRQTIHNLSS